MAVPIVSSTKSGPFWRCQTSRSFLSRGRRGVLWYSNMFHNVSKDDLCGRRNIFRAVFGESQCRGCLKWWQLRGRCGTSWEGHFAWQGQSLLQICWVWNVQFITLYTLHSTPPSTLYILLSTLHTLHSTLTLHTLHFTLETPHFTLYTLHSNSTLYTLHSTLYTLHSTLYTLHSTLHTLHSTLYTSHFALHTCTLHLTPHTHYTLHFTLHSALYTPHFELYTRHSTL